VRRATAAVLRRVCLVATAAGLASPPDAAGASTPCDAPTPAVALRHQSPGQIGAGFGVRTHPILGTARMHQGIDYAAPVGDPVVAAATGVVTLAGYSGESGNRVEIAHGGGMVTTYSHLRSAPAVRVGDCVRGGDAIGLIGSTGLAAGPHLHFEVLHEGRPVDPSSLLPAR
jgi:murein DD-endopeptidase MepM/ murein hydrolase activator NlpD